MHKLNLLGQIFAGQLIFSFSAVLLQLSVIFLLLRYAASTVRRIATGLVSASPKLTDFVAAILALLQVIVPHAPTVTVLMLYLLKTFKNGRKRQPFNVYAQNLASLMTSCSGRLTPTPGFTFLAVITKLSSVSMCIQTDRHVVFL